MAWLKVVCQGTVDQNDSLRCLLNTGKNYRIEECYFKHWDWSYTSKNNQIAWNENEKSVISRGAFSFSENLACFVFLQPPFWDSAFCLFTDELILSSEGLTFRILLVFNKTKENSQESYESIMWFKQIPGGVPFLC